jgi:HPt (histidine-containing phosphotransfer) domain-containing protein
MPDTLDQAALANLLAMVGDDPEFVDELVGAYLEDAPVQVAAIRAAVDSGDATALVRPAHTLKGSSQNLGASRVAELSRALEERGRSGDLSDAGDLIDDLDRALRDLAGALDVARSRRWAAA